MPKVEEVLNLSTEVDRLADDIYGYRRRVDFFLTAIHNRWPGRHRVRVLDVGCGTGKFVTIPLARAGHQVLGIDFDESSLALGRSLADGLPNVEFRCENAADLATRERFDVVVASEVLEHLHEPAVLVRECRELLTDDGLLLVTVPNGRGVKELDNLLHQWLARRLPLAELKDRLRTGVDAIARRGKSSLAGTTSLTTLNKNDPHVQFFSVWSFRDLLERNGFQIELWRSKMFLAGPTLNPVLTRLGSLRRWNSRAADHVPAWMASGWMIAATRRPSA